MESFMSLLAGIHRKRWRTVLNKMNHHPTPSIFEKTLPVLSVLTDSPYSSAFRLKLPAL